MNHGEGSDYNTGETWINISCIDRRVFVLQRIRSCGHFEGGLLAGSDLAVIRLIDRGRWMGRSENL